MSYDTLNFFFCKSNNLDGAFGVDPEGVKFRRKLKGSNILSASFDSCANPTQRHLDGGFAGPVDRGQGQSLRPRSTDLDRTRAKPSSRSRAPTKSKLLRSFGERFAPVKSTDKVEASPVYQSIGHDLRSNPGLFVHLFCESFML